jgi:hypothetical protein
VGKPEGKRTLGRPKRKWVDNVKMDLRETGWDDVDWIDMAQFRDQWWAVVNNDLSGSTKCCEILEYLHNLQLLKKGSAL